MSENIVENNVVKKSKACGIVGLVFSTIALGILLFIWGFVLYAHVSKDVGAAIGAAIYFAIGVFAQLPPMLVGVICGIVQKEKVSSKFSTFAFCYTLIIAIISIASVLIAVLGK